jgi:hypothetical protein
VANEGNDVWRKEAAVRHSLIDFLRRASNDAQLAAEAV